MNEIERLKDVTKRVEAGLSAISPDLKEDKQRELKSALYAEWQPHLDELKRRISSRQASLEAERAALQDPGLALFETAYKRHGHSALQLIENLTPEQMVFCAEKYRDPLITSKVMTAFKDMEKVDRGLIDRMQAHVSSYTDNQQIKYNANQSLECLTALYEAEAVTSQNGGDPANRLAMGRKMEELKKIIGD